LEQQQNPPDEVIKNGIRTAETIFEPAHAIVGRMHISSGYRCPELNGVLPLASKTSAHPDGRALDCEPLEMNLIEAYIRIANSDIPYDQLILEYRAWVHLGAAKEGAEPRRELLMIFEQGHYLPFDENDPRVIALA
jgi:hypothetical protein